MTAVVQVQGKGSRINTQGNFTKPLWPAPHSGLSSVITTKPVGPGHSHCSARNAKHNLDARLCRWLLIVHDRVDGNDLHLTQESLRQMLGAQRTSVNLAARALQEAGLVEYRRGRVTVINREGLEEAACECYAIGRKHFDRLMLLGPAG